MLWGRENNLFIFLEVKWGKKSQLGRVRALFKPRRSAQLSRRHVYLNRLPLLSYTPPGGVGVPVSGGSEVAGLRGPAAPGLRSWPLRMPGGSTQGRRQRRAAARSSKERRKGSEDNRFKEERHRRRQPEGPTEGGFCAAQLPREKETAAVAKPRCGSKAGGDAGKVRGWAGPPARSLSRPPEISTKAGSARAAQARPASAHPGPQ